MILVVVCVTGIVVHFLRDCHNTFTSLHNDLLNHSVHHLIKAVQYFFHFCNVHTTAGIATFSSTGVATAHIVHHIAHPVAISHIVASLPFSKTGIAAQVIPHTAAHCAVLHSKVGASFVGHTARVSPIQVITLPVLAQTLHSKY
jgi:hypothetical protein